MKKQLLITTLILFNLYTVICSAKQHTESLDQIVAVVNDDIITRSELNHSLNIIKMQIAQQNTALPPSDLLTKQTLDQLINKKIQLQIAKQAGITISDADLNQAITFIAKQNNMSVDELFTRINRDGMSTKDYKDEMRDQITLQKLQQQEIGGRLTISPDEITSFLHSNVWQNNTLREYRIQDIVIPLDESASKTEINTARQLADRLSEKLKNNPKVALGDNKVQSTDLGWRKLEEIPSLFTTQLLGMQANDISAPIQAPNGIHLLRLTDVRVVGGQAAPTRKQAEEILLQRKFSETIQTFVSKQRGQAFIETKLEA